MNLIAFRFILIAVLCLFNVQVGARAEDIPPAVSLSGKMAFVALSNNIWQIWVMDLSDRSTTQLTNSIIDKRTPTWSSDGKKIVYRTTAGTLEQVSIETKETSQLAPSLGYLVDPRISPTGSRIAFARFESDPSDNTNIYICKLGSTELTRLTSDPRLDYAPAWSPDEAMIAYVCGRGCKKHFLHVMKTDGSAKKQLQDVPSDDMFPSWSPDGAWILFSSSRSGDYEIWRVHPTGDGLEMLTNSPGLDTSPCYAPDGSRVAFTSNREGSLRVWTMLPDGSGCSPLTPKNMQARDPAWWQPSGKAEPSTDRKSIPPSSGPEGKH